MKYKKLVLGVFRGKGLQIHRDHCGAQVFRDYGELPVGQGHGRLHQIQLQQQI